MTIIAHAVLQDDPLNHAAWLEYKGPCVAEAFSPPGSWNWSWSVRFLDSDGDGIAELLMIRAAHRASPHAGETVNAIGPVFYLHPCRITSSTQTLVPDPHGMHEDRMFTTIRVTGFLWWRRHRLYVVLRHVGGDARIDIPDLPTGNGGLVAANRALNVETGPTPSP